MKKYLPLIFALCISASQAQRRTFSLDAGLHVNTTLYDRTRSNNATGFGFEMRGLLTKKRLQPLLEFNSDVYGGTKELFLTSTGKPIMAKSAVTTVFAGAQYKITPQLFSSVSTGIAFFNSEVHPGLRMGLGFYFFKDRLLLRSGWNNIFQQDDISHQGFGYISTGLSVRIF